MTTFHFQTHVSESGVITLPPDARNLYGKDVVVNVDLPSKPKLKRSFEEFCTSYDQIRISTKGWTFDREELYGDRL